MLTARDELRKMIKVGRAFKDVMAQLNCLPSGGIMNLHATGGKSNEHPGGRRPSGEEYPPDHEYAEKWANARSLSQMEAVLAEAQEELRSWKHSKAIVVTDDREVLKDRILKEGQDWEARDVAHALRTTIKVVQRVRVDAGRDPLKGRLVEKRSKWAR